MRRRPSARGRAGSAGRPRRPTSSRQAAARSSAGSRSRRSRPPSPTPCAPQRVELVELAGVAVDDQRMPVAVVRMRGRALDRHVRRDRVRALVALVGVVERHARLRRLLAVHDDVGDADARAVVEAVAEVGVHAARRAPIDADQRRRVRRDRQLVDRLVPHARRREHGAAGERAAVGVAPRAERRRGRARSRRRRAAFTVAGVAPPIRPPHALIQVTFVQAVVAVPPELVRVGDQPVAAPALGARRLARAAPRPPPRAPRASRSARDWCEAAALRLEAAGRRRPVRVGLRGGQPLDAALDAHLDPGPVEEERGARVRLELASLARRVAGEER